MPHPRSVLFNAYWATWTALFLAPLVVFAASGSPARPLRSCSIRSRRALAKST